MMFSVLTFNVGDIWAEGEWNNNRWKTILAEIVTTGPDIVILHEISKDSAEIFIALNDYGYGTYIPYVDRRDRKHARDNWEVIYCKFPVSLSFYVPLSLHEGLSCIRCVIQTEDGSYVEINISATTWNPITRSDIKRLTAPISQILDARKYLLLSVSSNTFGSFIRPPKGFTDVRKKLKSTLSSNKILCSHRADHIWVSNIVPKYIHIITVENGSEHNGFLTKYLTQSRIVRIL